MVAEMKTCLSCGATKPVSGFHRDRQCKDGFHPYCRVCKLAKAAARRAANPQAVRNQANDWNAQNAERKRAASKRWNDKNPKQSTKWAQANRERFREAQRRWKKANPDKVRESARRRYERNMAHHKAVGKKWQLANPQKLTAANNRRRALKLKAMPKWLTAIQCAQIEEFYEIALARTIQSGVKHHVDHIVPLQGATVCGLHVPWNLQVITATENHRKGRRLISIDGGDNR